MAVMSNSLQMSVNGSPWSMETETLCVSLQGRTSVPVHPVARQASIFTTPQAEEVGIACVCSGGSPHTERGTCYTGDVGGKHECSCQ